MSLKNEIKIGAVYDIENYLGIYGLQQVQALRLAVEQMNEQGGINGSFIKLIEYDTKSDISKYETYTKLLTTKDRVSAIFGGVTSSSREIIRPIIRAAKIPYFYTTFYEGGACDKYTFITGPTPSQQLRPLLKWAMSRYGKRIFLMAPSYNFGTITGEWIKVYVKEFGGELVGEDYLPLNTTNYNTTINSIRLSKPDILVALPVGDRQSVFLEDFSKLEYSLRKDIQIVSTTWGSGNQQLSIDKKASHKIISSFAYLDVIDTEENRKFKQIWYAKYGDQLPIIPMAVHTWNAFHFWAMAVQKVNSTNSKKVIAALESGFFFNAPNGLIRLLPHCHHTQLNIYFGQIKNLKFKIIKSLKALSPSFEESVCDLIKNPRAARHYTP